MKVEFACCCCSFPVLASDRAQHMKPVSLLCFHGYKGQRACFANMIYFIIIPKMHVQDIHAPIFPRKDVDVIPIPSPATSLLYILNCEERNR